MKTPQQVNKQNARLLSVAAYVDLTQKYKSDEQVSEWNGKEMNEMSWILVRVVTQSQRGISPAKRYIFNHTMGCIRALCEFFTYAQ
jgi:hypothetical protein